MAMPANVATSREGGAHTPSTPPPAHAKPEPSIAVNGEKSPCTSPPAISSSMTPPPSTQPLRFYSPDARSSPNNVEPTLSPLTAVKFDVSNSLPTVEKITSASIDELRVVAQDLVCALSEARMSAAHFKLQHTLLLMETREAAQRAEVEQQMTRREVEVLHAAEQRHRAAANTPRISAQPSPQPQVTVLTKTCKDLEEERDVITERFHEVRKLLDLEHDRVELLAEENTLLKKRIRENREHFTKLKESPIYATPRQAFTTPRRKSYSRFADETPAHEPFAALLYADQMLSQETASVPSTPLLTKSHASRIQQGHVRGAHSLSSLRTTPVRRPVTSDGNPPASAPGSQSVDRLMERDQRDRDSTISISDAEDGNAVDVGQSQASSLATNMLRKNPRSQESIRQSQEAERSSSLLQTKLFGNVKKPGSVESKGKRSRESYTDESIQSKKKKLNDSVGLGVGFESWNRSAS